MLRLFALDVGLRFRGRGIGTALIEAVERRARRQGLRGVNLEVGVDNGDAIRLYERLGYRRRGSPVAGESSWIVTKSL
jgi:ribosomal protein S18 acetylase RimI-like enzyme